jgi:hypothetical protein
MLTLLLRLRENAGAASDRVLVSSGHCARLMTDREVSDSLSVLQLFNASNGTVAGKSVEARQPVNRGAC